MVLNEYDMFYEPPAEISVKKDVCYTIKVIGGKDEYREYMREKAIRTASAQKAQREAYLARRVFLEGIVEGRADATPQALHIPPTLKRYQMQLGKEFVQAKQVEMPSEKPPEAPTWYERVCEQVKNIWPLRFCILFLCFMSVNSTYAAFGGARGGGGRSFSAPSVRSSSFGGSRGAMGGNVTISRPSRTYSAPPSTTVIHQNSSGSGFMNGLMMGTILSQPHGVVVAQQPQTMGGVPLYAGEAHGFLYYLFWGLLTLGVIIALIAVGLVLVGGAL